MNSRRREKHEARTCRFGKERQNNIIVMRTVEFNQAVSGGKGLNGGVHSNSTPPQSPPLPPAPPNLAHTVLLRCSARHQHQKGTLLIS